MNTVSARWLARTMAPPPPPEIHVCQSGTCRARGSDATLAEIEELAGVVGACVVRPIGCLGACRRGPAVLVVAEDAADVDPSDPSPPRRQRVHVNVDTLEASANVVEQAMGTRPALDSPGLAEKFAGLRLTRTRQHARSVFRWNTALRGLQEQAMAQV